MAYPIVKISYVHNVFVRMMHFEKANDHELSHKHEFDHITFLASGTLKVLANGKETIFKAPQLIYIKKDVVHELFALEDNTVASCIHTINVTDNMVSPDMVPNGIDSEQST
jgi:quercetin dioxygenase-like cupin family protein